MVVEYSNGKGEDAFAYFVGILKCQYILINIIPSQTMHGETIGQGINIVHGVIGTMICCNNGLVSLGANLFVYLSLKHLLVLRVGQLSR